MSFIAFVVALLCWDKGWKWFAAGCMLISLLELAKDWM